MADILASVRAVVDAHGPDALLDPTRWLALDERARRDWGGERPYIAKAGESAQVRMATRNAAIVRDHERGERVALIARRYGISEARVRGVLFEARSAE